MSLINFSTTHQIQANTTEYYMQQALHYAKQSLSLGEVPIGCVFVHNNIIIGTGMNETNESLNVIKNIFIKNEL